MLLTHDAGDAYVKSADLADREPQYIVNKMSKVSGKGYFMSLTQLEEVGQYKYEAGVYVGSETFRISSEIVTIPLDTWVHLVVTYDGTSLTLWMSEDVDSLTMVKNGTWAEDPVMFGKRNTQPLHIGESFFGLIDELKIFQSVLAVNESIAHGVCPSHKGGYLYDDDLVAYYRFNEGFGNFTRDLSKYDVPGVHGLTCAHVDQNQNASISCPHEYYISEILYANYGLNEGTCGGYTADDSCLNVTLIDEIKKRCVNEDERKQECSIPAYNDLLGNACPGTRKSLAIQAICKPNDERLRFDINECRSFSGYYPGDCGDTRWSLDHAPTKVGVASTLSEPSCPYAEATSGLVPPALLKEGSCADWDLSTAVAGVPSTFALFVLDGCGYVDFTHEDHRDASGGLRYGGMLEYTEIETHFNNASFDMSKEDSCAPTTSKEQNVYLSNVWAGASYCNGQMDAYMFSFTMSAVGNADLSFSLADELIFATPVVVVPGAISAKTVVSGAGLTMAEAGVPTAFTITAYDGEGNAISELSDDDLEALAIDVDSKVITRTTVDGGVVTISLVFPAKDDYALEVKLGDTVIAASTVKVSSPESRSPTLYSAGPPEERFEHSAVTIDNAMYVFGGARKDKTYLSETWKLTVQGATEYKYRTEVMVSGDMMVGMTMPLLINTEALIADGYLQANCGDMLFMFESGETADYWVDPLPGCGSDEAIVWVKVAMPGARLFLYHGAPLGATMPAAPASMFDLYEGFDGAVFTSEGGNWELDDSCTNLQFPAGDEKAFYTSELNKLTGKSALKADTNSSVGGSITWNVGLDYASGFVMKAYMYDSGCDSTHWISPNFEDCAALDNGKSTLPVKNALGINTCAVQSKYSQAYPWASTHVNRTAGWHSFTFYSDGASLSLLVDDVPVETDHTDKASLINKIVIHAGSDNGSEKYEQPSFWDSVFVTKYAKDVSIALSNDTEAVSYIPGTTWEQLSAAGPPARQGHSAIVVDDAMVVYGGERSAYEYSDIWMFNTTTATWSFVSPAEDKAPPRHDHSAVYHEGGMYVYGGRGPTPLGDFWMFDMAAGAWVEMPASTGMAARFGHTAVVIGDSMVVYGGYVDQVGLSDEVWSFNFTSSSWTLLGPRASNFDELGTTPYVADVADAILFPADIPAARFAHTAAATATGMFVYGGAGGATMREALDDCWFFDLTEKTWVPVFASTGSARYDAAASMMIMTEFDLPVMAVYGGHGPSGFLSDTQFFFAGYTGSSVMTEDSGSA